MFFIFSKEKIASYAVAISTVAILFTMSVMVNKDNAIETSTNTTEDIKVYNMQKDKNDINNNKIQNGLQ